MLIGLELESLGVSTDQEENRTLPNRGVGLLAIDLDWQITLIIPKGLGWVHRNSGWGRDC